MEKKNEFTNEELAQAVRWDIIEMIYRAGMGHPGSSLSCVEILVALYLGGVMNVDPQNPDWPERDRFVLSKAMPRRHCIRCWHAADFSPVKRCRHSVKPALC